MTPREKMVELARAEVEKRLRLEGVQTEKSLYDQAFDLARNALYEAGYDGADLNDVALEVAAVYSQQFHQ